jgi:hypothetical protein
MIRIIAFLAAAGAAYMAYTNTAENNLDTAWKFAAAAIALAAFALWPRTRKRWETQSDRDNARYMSGEISHNEYWTRVHGRDARIKRMSPAKRRRINRT